MQDIKKGNAEVAALMEKTIKLISSYIPKEKIEVFKEAYDFSKKAHANQIRKSGDPFLIHPLKTTEILAGLRMNEDILIAGILHDVIEDTNVSLSEIEKRFGSKIAYLVDGVTKLSKVNYREGKEQRHIESLKKLFQHSARDLRVILIKLADRLDNMRTLSFITDEQKRRRIAEETMDIYIPITNLLGLGEIHDELEDLCFCHLIPENYNNLKQTVGEKTEERDFILDETIEIIKKELERNRVRAEIQKHYKSLYSIYKQATGNRQQAAGPPEADKQAAYDIADIAAIVVIVSKRRICYVTLGIIHRLFKPKFGKFKDFIAVPKPNGYRSLHTTVSGLDGHSIEFQIRTQRMHLDASYGITANYFYKRHTDKNAIDFMQQRANWVQRIWEMQKENEVPSDFLENLKMDVFQDRILVFSPKGDFIDLPVGASCIDYAYAIHADIGNHAAQAEINGVLCPITTTLGNGDKVNIITGKNVQPDINWLKSAKTSLALHKIKEYLRTY